MKEALLTPALFKLLGGLVEERTGVQHAEHALEPFSTKVFQRLAETGFETPLDYYYYLRYDAASEVELRALTDELVVNETYFFRESAQLLSLRDDVLRPLVEKGLRPRIWCAASSTGEEPLSMAMLLAEAGMLSQVEIVASDISEKALARARNGEHTQLSLRACPPELLERYIEVRSGRVTVAPAIRATIDWRHLNLLDAPAVASLGTFDGILCRNVLIYFSDETILRVVRSLSNALRSGGHLFVGAAESLIRFGGIMRFQETNGAFSYSRNDG